MLVALWGLWHPAKAKIIHRQINAPSGPTFQVNMVKTDVLALFGDRAPQGTMIMTFGQIWIYIYMYICMKHVYEQFNNVRWV